MGRPATKPVKLKDGYYIEVKNKGESSGVKIRRASIDQVKMAMRMYEHVKDVNFLGEVKNGKMIQKKLT